MHFPERKITLKDGRKCILRPNGPDLAEPMLEYLKATAGETEFLLRYPDEVNYTLEGEIDILGRLLEDPYQIMMAPIVDGKVAGNEDFVWLHLFEQVTHNLNILFGHRQLLNLTALVERQVEEVDMLTVDTTVLTSQSGLATANQSLQTQNLLVIQIAWFLTLDKGLYCLV